MAFSTESADRYLEHVGRNAPWLDIGDAGGLLPSATPGNLFVSFHTADLVAGNLANVSESADLARQAIVRSAAGFSAPEAGTIANSRRIRNAAIIEVTNTGGSPAAIVCAGLTTALSGATHIILADRSFSATVPAGDILRIPVGGLSFQLVTLPLT